jgi:hypothetical protein
MARNSPSKWTWARFFLALLLLTAPKMNWAWAHPMPSSAVELRMHRTHIDAQLTLPIIELRLGWDKPLPLDATLVVRQYGEKLKDYLYAHVHPTAPDGRPWTVTVGDVIPVIEQNPDVRVSLTMAPPPGAPVDQLTLHYDAIFHHLITHTAIVTLNSDWHTGVVGQTSVLLGTMRDTNPVIVIDRSQGSWLQGFTAMFRLGARHIAEGTDHLLFLLALLLPAPLAASGRRWSEYAGGKAALRRIIKVVSAFTLGHSVTLLLGALEWVHLPETVVESAIALSIFVSASHAFAPIFRRKEAFIAGGFGLVHGLAFASTLTEFGLDPLTMVSSVLAFNLGIEVVQLSVILITVPWLMMLARSPIYTPFRISGATFTGIAAASWFMERAFGWSSPLSPVVESLASHAVWLLISLIGLTVITTLASKIKVSPVDEKIALAN